ncbi:hypothetical protein M407DRAFT_22541 [Tulasnella calospora MUT 4182]|uniref:Uncharacterized protein n=1 Tax=Tulasnella calospora MUT 4182 TaxID=1051891 RepID=A0A0C3QC35_9AGAM|nr:hypothetical protein M407DRAFT_33075 [Tulasnella calospora MUT 4182]KIO28205.1 hypothetical protein M407DRAFT_22541 [Tulasnella calospora MUT 4182]
MDEIEQSRKGLVSQAISVLVDGICKQNDCGIQYSGIEWADALPADRFLAIGDDLKAVQVQLNQQVNKLTARLAYRRNLSSLVHRLPPEVLMTILEEFKPTPPHPDNDDSLFDLLLVCRTWYETIIGSSQLWGYFAAKMPYKIARLVIDRSQMHPISVYWHTNQMDIRSASGHLSKMIDLAVANSTRIRSVDIRVPGQSAAANAQRLLEAPTPALETLKVRVGSGDLDWEWDVPSSEFVLSEGSHLNHLSLQYMTAQLDTHRFSNLVTLILAGSSVPHSLKQLLHPLSSSQRLEVLEIQDSGRRVDGKFRDNAPVELLYLKRLVLSGIPGLYIMAIIASIYIPSCHYVVVRDRRVLDGGDEDSDEEDPDEEAMEDTAAIEGLDAIIWRPSNDQAASLVGGTDSGSGRSALSIQIFIRRITIETLNSLQGHRELLFARTDIPRLMARLGTTISQLPSPPGLHLKYMDSHTRGQIPVDLLPWSEVIESLFVEGNDSCRSVLQQLSQRHVILETGGVDWICKKLETIRLVYNLGEKEENTAPNGEALLSLVRQRWSGEDGFPPAVRPTTFMIYCNKTKFPNLWSLEDEIARIIPSFRFIDRD